MNRDNEDGFTLIELLVVIIIIGILAAIAIPVFLSQKTKGYEASMKSDLRTAAQEVEAFNVDTQNYSTTFWKTASTVAVAGSTAASAITGPGQVVGGSNTVNLSSGNTIYWIGSTTTSFCLKATHTGATAWYYSSAGGGLSKTACTS
ncbi:MAG TPA: prepilin-type N-terminal cleavage/methylation domain-containing protein [Frankiaceae bacterium]|jgi:prepilin-type N-terminal cleavage/methylation domain-containing protein|nr:prepilin-type N-terminal cleavage/methylation domain-containing protein [Frankiaceae bacterium]